MPTGWCCGSFTSIAASSRSSSKRSKKACTYGPSVSYGEDCSAPKWRIRATGSSKRTNRCRKRLRRSIPQRQGSARRRYAARFWRRSTPERWKTLCRRRCAPSTLCPPPKIDAASLIERTHPAWRRVKFDELLAQQLSLRLAYLRRRRRAAPMLRADGALLRAFARSLPFKLTRAQTRAMNDVLRDLVQPHPMQRLLQGDVGSGKTIVAAIACLAAADSDHQAAVMAPTEILSEQHARKFGEWLSPLGVRIAWLHGSLSARGGQQAPAAIACGDANIA